MSCFIADMAAQPQREISKMLSYIYQLCRSFEMKQGYRANVLFISPQHLEKLMQSFDSNMDANRLGTVLGLEILVRQDALHPSVHWLASAERRVG